MSDKSGIQWTEATWNPTSGCTRVSAGCDHCYAVRQTHRLEAMGQKKYAGLTVLNQRGDRHFNGVVRCVPEALEIPLRWKKPRRIFVNSMSDLFHRDVPFDFIDKVFAIMALCPQHTFQVLTKRPERMAEYLRRVELAVHHRSSTVRDIAGFLGAAAPMMEFHWEGGSFADITPVEHLQQEADAERFCWPLRNVWLGTSCEDQATADERIPHLLRCPAAVRFLSLEPLLAALEIHHWLPGGWLRPMGWVIVGGESGKGARPCDVVWIRSIRDQCKAAGVACFVKQLGAFAVEEHEVGSAKGGCPRPLNLRDSHGADPSEWPEDLRVREFPK